VPLPDNRCSSDRENDVNARKIRERIGNCMSRIKLTDDLLNIIRT
jgi:hypothetical protein